MKKLFPQFSTLKYKIYLLNRRLKYIRFILGKNNYEWDYAGWLNLNIFKLTQMGLHFAKWGIIIDEDRKRQVRDIWEIRKGFKHVLNSFDISYEKAQKQFKEKWGFEYDSDMTFSEPDDRGLCSIGFDVKAPHSLSEVQKKEIETSWYSIFPFGTDDTYRKEELKKALAILNERLFYLWD